MQNPYKIEKGISLAETVLRQCVDIVIVSSIFAPESLYLYSVETGRAET